MYLVVGHVVGYYCNTTYESALKIFFGFKRNCIIEVKELQLTADFIKTISTITMSITEKVLWHTICLVAVCLILRADWKKINIIGSIQVILITIISINNIVIRHETLRIVKPLIHTRIILISLIKNTHDDDKRDKINIDFCVQCKYRSQELCYWTIMK